jgi:hypothetical protein
MLNIAGKARLKGKKASKRENEETPRQELAMKFWQNYV